MFPRPGEKEISVKDYFHVLLKRRWVIVSIFSAIVVTTAIGSFALTPIYRATTVLLIERQAPKVVSIEEVYGMGAADTEYYETQYKILRSRTLIKGLFEEMDLYIEPEYSDEEDPIEKFLEKLIIDPVKNSRLVNLSLEGPDPEKITIITNTMAELYIKQDLSRRTQTSRAAVEWLVQQLKLQKQKLQSSEQALQEYMEEKNIVSLTEVEEQSTDLVDRFKEQKAQLELEFSELSKRYGEKHPRMVSIDSELDSIDEKLKFETDRIMKIRRKAIQYNVLKREVESNRRLYEILLKRSKETGVSEELETSNIRVVDPAEVPQIPVRPRKALNIFLAFILGITLGSSMAFFIEYLDNTIKGPEDIEQYIDLPFLGYVPSCKKEAKNETETDLVASAKPRSVVTEAYRSIRTSVVFAFADRPSKTILVTSSEPGEGKTTVAINLATTMAQAGEKVLLVDTDMRCPRLHTSFTVESEKGLSDLLVGKITEEEAVKPTHIPNLSIITCGAIPPNPAELLGTDKMKAFLEKVSENFNKVILDSPPILTVTDSVILSNFVKGVIMVVRAGKTQIEVAQRARQRLVDAKAAILGTIVNNVDMVQESAYYYYYGEYGRDSKRT